MKTELEIANERILELEEQVKKLTSNTVLADSLPPSEVRFIATRFAHQCRLKGVATNNDTVNLYDEWIKDFRR
jgi:hypothetical protein